MPPKKNEETEVVDDAATEETSTEDTSVEDTGSEEEQGSFDFLNDMDFGDEEEEDLGTDEEEEAADDEAAAEEAGEEDAAEEVTASQEEEDKDEGKEKSEEEEAKAQSTQPQSEEKESAPAGDEDINAQFEEFFNKSVDTLAEHVYGLSDEEKKSLDEEPSKMIPKLAARLHMQVLTASLTQAANLMPHFVEQTQTRSTREAELENQFYGQFPALKSHPDEVKRIATAYRQAYPDLDSETLIQEVGTAASVRLRVPLPGQEQQPSRGNEAPSAPPKPSAARGSGTPVAAPQEQKSWLEDILIEED